MNPSDGRVGHGRRAGRQREHDVAVGVGVDRVDRPGHAVVAGAGDAGQLGLGQLGVGGDDGERRVGRLPGRGGHGRSRNARRSARDGRRSIGELAGQAVAGAPQLAGRRVDRASRRS